MLTERHRWMLQRRREPVGEQLCENWGFLRVGQGYSTVELMHVYYWLRERAAGYPPHWPPNPRRPS